jgi:hypothetical protein
MQKSVSAMIGVSEEISQERRKAFAIQFIVSFRNYQVKNFKVSAVHDSRRVLCANRGYIDNEGLKRFPFVRSRSRNRFFASR